MSRNHYRRHRNHGKKRFFSKRHPPVGAAPGALVIRPEGGKPAIGLIQYAPESVHQEQIQDPGNLRGIVREDRVTWIDVQGLGDECTLRTIADIFHLHPLELADIVNVPQRPKVQAYGDNLLIITRMAMLHPPYEIEMEQISIVIGPHFVLTFQERYGDIWDPVRVRIRDGIGSLRRSGPDFLAYSIIDATIDGYYPVLETLGERLEDLEDQIIAGARPEALHTVHDVKRDLLSVRRGIWPQRETLGALIRDENPQISQMTRTYLRDCYDHCVQVIDVIETYRELAGGLMDLYLSSVANRQNDIMRVLTVIATIFMPLTFLVGVYGMNFKHMPELEWFWGYPLLLVSMAVIAGGMLVYFGRKGWLRP